MALDGSSFEREIAVKNQNVSISFPELLAHARRKSGRKPLSIALEEIDEDKVIIETAAPTEE